MKKLFCKLPPLQWASFLTALIAAILQTLAMLLQLDSSSNYFTRGARLPRLAVLFALLSFALGLAAALTAKKKNLAATANLNLRKLHIFPAIGFLFALVGLALNLLIQANEHWEHRNDGTAFLKDFLIGENKPALLCLPLLLFAAFYCVHWAFSKKENQTEITLLGFAAVIACALLGVHIYFDFSVEINSPIKSFLQGDFLSAMVFFTSELRLPLKKPIPKLLLTLSNLVLSMASLCAVAVPVAFFAGNISDCRIDHFFYSLFQLFMIPVATQHILTIYTNSPDPDAERTETL